MKMFGPSKLWLSAIALLSLTPHSFAQGDGNGTDTNWVTIWGSMPQLTEPANLPPPPFNGSNVVFQDATIRQTITLTAPASTIRLQISNAFGTVPLPLTSVTIALPSKQSLGISSIDTTTLHSLTLSGTDSFIVPNGALVVSDPITFDEVLPAHTIISISIYLKDGQQTNFITSHPGSRTTSHFLAGNHVKDGELKDSTTADHWYLISAIEALDTTAPSSIVCFGDSLTDGRGSTTNGNNRWPDIFSQRLQSSSHPLAIINQAAGGNRLLADGLGPSGLSRVDRDILSHSGVSHVIIFHGVNDIGTTDPTSGPQAAIGKRVIQAYEQIAARVKRHGIKVFGATITPFTGPEQVYGHPEREKTRQAVNKWIRSTDKFDGVIDFDEVVRDPKNKTILLKKYDEGDHLHMNPTGYKAMAESIDLSWFD